MMYAIYKMADGFRCEGRIQDGTERWTESSLEEAIKSMKRFAKTMNGTKIKRRDIHYFEPVHIQRVEWKEMTL